MSQNESTEMMFLDLVDKIKIILAADLWQKVNCSKNELYVMLYLYRNSNVNMTELADYLEVPLNTATGIISRMEKHELLKREKSPEDKRVITIVLTDGGRSAAKEILGELMGISELILESFTDEETIALIKLIDKMVRIVEPDKN
ncbi:MAG: MarR family winged helix-turn-helix transcriptional regulator [Eubacteriaceae bacterium]|jgi:DNA-binding MarR family transcriptional regulator